MPIEFVTSLDLNLLYGRWSGDVDIGDWRGVFQDYLTDVHYVPGRPELIDLTDLKSLDADFNRLWSTLTMVNRQVPETLVHTRTVLIAPDDMVYGLSRIYQSLAENAGGIVVEIHRDEASALAALGFDHGSVAALLAAGNFLAAEAKRVTANGP